MCFVCSTVSFDEGMLVSQMSQWRGGHSGKGGEARKAKALKHGVGRSISSRPGSTYSLSRSTGVLCGQGCFCVTNKFVLCARWGVRGRRSKEEEAREAEQKV